MIIIIKHYYFVLKSTCIIRTYNIPSPLVTQIVRVLSVVNNRLKINKSGI